MKTLSSFSKSARRLLGALACASAFALTVASPSAWAQPAPEAQPAPAEGAAAPAEVTATGAPAPAPADAAAAPSEPAAPTGAAAAPAAAPAPAPAPAPAAAPAGGDKKFYEKEAAKPHDTSGTYWLPKSVNSATTGTDTMFYAVLAMSFFFFFAITFAVIYFVWKYRHRPGHKAQPSASHNDAMEITWTVIPSIICVFLFVYGWRGYVAGATPPRQALEVQVLAYRWGWNFTHYNGVQDSDLHVPVNTPVRLVMTSKDVLHSFFVPVLRTKQDLVPRRYTYVWFEASKPGTYRLYCTEYCGKDHSQMKVKLVVHPTGGYERYLEEKGNEGGNLPPAEYGKQLYEKKGCNACHSLDGSPRVGPSFKGIFGSKIKLASGDEVDGDENYLRTSILVPTAQARPGFPPSMPSFEGQLKEKELAALIEFIKSLK